MKTKNFWKKGNLSSEEEMLAPFFPYYRTWHMSENLFWRSTSFFDYYSGTYRSFFFGPERLLKTNVLKKKANFPVKKNELTNFNSFYRLWQTSGNKLQVSTSYSYQYCMNYRRTFLGPNRLLKTQIFEKKGKLFTEKKFGVYFSRFIECDKAQETKYKGPQAIFIIALQFLRACLGTKRLMKTQKFEKKRQTFQWKKLRDQFFSVLLSMTKLKEQIIRVHKVFWHLLWK